VKSARLLAMRTPMEALPPVCETKSSLLLARLMLSECRLDSRTHTRCVGATVKSDFESMHHRELRR